jgi:hypothetical protein
MNYSWTYNLIGLIIISLVIYYYFYPRYLNRDLLKKQKEAQENQIHNHLLKIYQEYYQQEPIITIPETEDQNPNPETLPEEIIRRKNYPDSEYFANNDPIRELTLYSDFVLRNGQYPPSNLNDGTHSELI